MNRMYDLTINSNRTQWTTIDCLEESPKFYTPINPLD